MRNKFVYFIVSLLIVSCSGKAPQNLNDSAEPSLSEKYSFIHDSKELNDSCMNRLSGMIEKIFFDSKTDTITSIHYLSADLFSGHYTKIENDQFEKYLVKIKKTDTTVIDFFVIKKNPSYLQVAHYIPEYDIITIEDNMMYVDSFSFLNNCNAGDLRELYLEVDSGGAMFSNMTYNAQSDSLFVVDSIFSTKNQECFFAELDSFYVNNTNQMIFKKSLAKINFEYDKYSLLFSNEKKSIRHWVVSNSHSHRILFDENKNYIFLSRIRKVL